MGHYTELIFGATIEAPKEIIDVLKFIETGKDKPKNYPFEDLGRIRLFSTGIGAYFGVNHNRFSVKFKWHYDDLPAYELNIRCNLKNYDREIERFLDWISPYIETGSGLNDIYAFVIEENDKEPTIYRIKKEVA